MYTPAYVELYQGDVDLHLRKEVDTESKFLNSLVTVFNQKKNIKKLPITFGYSIRYKTTVCGQPAYQTKYLFQTVFNWKQCVYIIAFHVYVLALIRLAY